MRKLAVLLAAAPFAAALALIFAVGSFAAALGLIGSPLATAGPSQAALADIPPDYLALFQSAAATCPGLPWTVPAAIGKVESDFGRSDAPGVQSGTNAFGAAGPMQMGVGGVAGPTFFAYDHPVPADPAPTPAGGAEPPSPYNPADAVYAAVRNLCTNGGGDPATLRQAIFSYNHSKAYVDEVLSVAASYSVAALTPSPSGPLAAAVAVAYAIDHLGVPYRWGGESETAFDCSGLVQAAYAVAGLALPRVAQDQYDAGPHLRLGEALEPGDLVFFGSSPASVDHVGIYVGQQMMIDAPHEGALVRLEDYRWADYLGATRPSGLSVSA